MRALSSVGTILALTSLALITAGCGSTPAAAGGDRIKTRALEGSDGSRAFLSLYDVDLKIDCAYATASDGKMRCLPKPNEDMDLFEKFSGSDFMYGDPACTIQIGHWSNDKGCAPPAFASVVFSEDKDTCSPGAHIFPVKEQFTGFVSDRYYHMDREGGPCEEGDYKSTQFYVIGPELPASRFVEGTEVID